MKKGLIAVCLLALASLSLPSRADVILLVHGYLSGAQGWDASGVTAALERNDWHRAGVFVAGPAGVRLFPVGSHLPKNTYYAADLPSEAPILVQVYQLNEMLRDIRRDHPGEPIVLVGHSAGGIVARAALVRGGAENVKALITIASPHLGTVRAEQALDASDIPFPLSIMADMFAGETYDIARRSRGLYVDLVRPRPGTLLYWLNAQPHPDITYISVVRGESAAGWGDVIVPPYSQDMNNVPALRGHASTITVPVEHGLAPVDGRILVKLLSGL